MTFEQVARQEPERMERWRRFGQERGLTLEELAGLAIDKLIDDEAARRQQDR